MKVAIIPFIYSFIFESLCLHLSKSHAKTKQQPPIYSIPWQRATLVTPCRLFDERSKNPQTFCPRKKKISFFKFNSIYTTVHPNYCSQIYLKTISKVVVPSPPSLTVFDEIWLRKKPQSHNRCMMNPTNN